MVKALHEATMDKIGDILDRQTAATNIVQTPQTEATGRQGPSRRSVKIEELLKPKEPLTEARDLEEMKHPWARYEAFLDHNKNVLND